MKSSSWILVLAGLLASACNEVKHVTRVEPSSFKVRIYCAGRSATDCPAVPAGSFTCPGPFWLPDLGTPETPVDRSQVFYMAQVTTLDSNGEFYPGYDGTANVYVQFEGTTTPARDVGVSPLATLPFQDGQACLTVTIPSAFNQTTIWVEEPSEYADDPEWAGHRIVTGSFAAGASQPIYRPAPYITDVAFTKDKAQQMSELNRKHVIFAGGTDGADIVVTFVASTYFTVTDMGTNGEDRPWGSLEVYTNSQPELVRPGYVLSNLAGSVSNFNGLSELNFALYDIVKDANGVPVTVPLPTPRRIRFSDLPKVNPGGTPNLLVTMAPYKSGLVQIVSDSSETWQICALHGDSLESYNKYAEWIVTSPEECGNQYKYFDVVTASTIPSFDPLANAGKKICSLTGILSVISPTKSGTFVLWVITPRGPSDLGTLMDAGVPCP